MILGPVKHITYSYGFRVFTRTMDSQSDGDLQSEIHCPGSSSTVEGHESRLECRGSHSGVLELMKWELSSLDSESSLRYKQDNNGSGDGGAILFFVKQILFFRQPCKLYIPTTDTRLTRICCFREPKRKILYPSVSAIQCSGCSEGQAGILGPYPVGSFDQKHLSLHVPSLPAEAILGAVQW